jgi:very-short-patch-repair endonuclease
MTEMKEYVFLPYNKNLVELARLNRKNPTAAERVMWTAVLRGRQLADYKFLRQKPIDGYIVDFYCGELALVIEIDGDSHRDKLDDDAERTRLLNAYGLTVLRYTNTQVLQTTAAVRQHLLAYIETASCPLP